MSWAGIAEVSGWLGAASVLLAYGLAAAEILRVGIPFHLLNLIGASLLVLSAGVNEAYPFVGLNVIWAMVAFVSIVRIALQLDQPASKD